MSHQLIANLLGEVTNSVSVGVIFLVHHSGVSFFLARVKPKPLNLPLVAGSSINPKPRLRHYFFPKILFWLGGYYHTNACTSVQFTNRLLLISLLMLQKCGETW